MKQTSLFFAGDTSQFDVKMDFKAGVSELRFLVEPIWLHAGRYNCSVFLTQVGSIESVVWLWNQQRFTVEKDRRGLGNIPLIMPYKGHTLEKLSDETTQADARGTVSSTVA